MSSLVKEQQKKQKLTKKSNFIQTNCVFVLVGDKSCDIYKYDLETGACSLLFGHISLLLQMKISPLESSILTCDRDEKVRVTNYPSVYNIQTFLLGHREFVSCCTFVDQEHVVTGSGDSTIKLWEIINGKELASFDLSNCFSSSRKEAVEKCAESNAHLDERNANVESTSRRSTEQTNVVPNSESIKNKATKQSENRLAIKNVFYNAQSNRLVVVCFNQANLVTFELVERRFIIDQNIELPSNALDALEHDNELYVLTVNDALIRYEFKEKQLTRVHNRLLVSINDNQDLLKFNEKELVDDYLSGRYKFVNADSEDGEFNEKRKKLK